MGITINIQWILFFIKVFSISFIFNTGYLLAVTIVLAPSFIREVFRSIQKREPISYKVLFLTTGFINLWLVAILKYDGLYKYGIN